jgi:CRISPR/Cas system CSM-associated protein Csm2 small subunit
MDSASLVALASALLTVVSVVLGVKYRKGIEKARLFAELLDDVITAAEDDEVSEEEFHQIVVNAKKVAADVED